MAHSNPSLYPLPFPNEDQRIQISSYSSLANALGTDPGYASRQGRRPPPTNCDLVIDKQAIYTDSPPVNNPSYPYPARNVLNPGTYPARVPLSASNGSRVCNTSITWVEGSDQYHLGLPSWYGRLPQPAAVEPDHPDRYQAGAEFPAVHFLPKGNKMPYSLWDLLTMDTMPDLVDGDLPLFVQNPGRWIKIKLIWPGYSHYPFEKRISIKRSAPLTATLLLVTLAHHVYEFVRSTQNQGAVVEPGQERWTVTGVPEGAPEMWKNCVITSLQHLTGSVWQPEIYYLGA